MAPLALDDIDAPGGRARGVLGGSGAYASLAARHFAPTALASVVGDDIDDALLARLEGVDRSAVRRVRGPSLRWHGEHRADGTTLTLRNDLGATAGVVPPLDGASGAHVLVGAFAPAVQRRIRAGTGAARFVAVDTMRPHVDAAPLELRAALRGAGAALLTLDEARRFTGAGDARGAVRALRSLGVRLVVLKGGAAGATLWSDDELHVPAAPARAVDPTGAGDAFAGAFVATLAARDAADDATLALAMRRGAAAAAIAVRALGIEALAAATREEIEELARSLEPVAVP